MNPHRIALEPVLPTNVPGVVSALLGRRHTTRGFTPQPLDLKEIAGFAWAAQGSTTDGRRTCPSAHGLHPLTLTVVVGNVCDLSPGTYTYDPDEHDLTLHSAGDHRAAVACTTLADRDWLREAAAFLLLSGNLNAANTHFSEQPPRGRRGERYVWLEAGHASQNVYLAAAETGLGAALVAGFDDDQLIALDNNAVPPRHHPLALLAIGHAAGTSG